DLDGLAGKRIPGSDLTLESYGSGVITLTTSKLVTPGKAWSGVVGLLSFKSKKTGTISISYKVTPLPSGSIMPSTVNYSVSSSSDVQVAMTLNGNALLGVKNGAASLNPLTDYNITGNVATIKSAYIQDYFSKNPQQNLSLVLDYSSGYDPILTICKSTENSTIVTNYGVYDRRVPGDLAVQLKLNGNRLNGIMNGTSSLILDSDYSVSGDTVTLKQSYLDKLPLGYGNTLTFTFSSGNSATYTLTVNGAAISPDTISYNVSSPVSIPVTMSSCNYDFKTVRNGTFDLVKDTDYAVSGNILTIKPGYFTYYFSKFPTQTLNLKFIFANPNTGVEYPVNFKATPAANDSSISPVSDCFDLSNQSDRNITINLNGNTLKTVKNSTYTLISGTDYSLSGNVLTLKASYLNTLACGNYNITFSFSAGKDAVLALTVNQSQVDSTITPLSSIFDLGSQYDIPVTMTLNGNSLLSVVNSVYTLSAGTDYVLSGNTVTIKSDYLKNLPVSDAKLKFVFSAGSNAILTIHINGGSINPSSLNYNVTQHPSVVITTSTSGYNFKTIRNGPADLVLNVDYTVSGNSITLKSSYFTYYFGKFPTQTLNLTFVFERSGDKVEYPVSLKVTPVTQ
ncbi:MAG TPA: X2-like carbohydrate binding domain-containing protein, partial [Clostridia bacterium]